MNKLLKIFSSVVVLFLISFTLIACGEKYTVTFKQDGTTTTFKTNDKVSKPNDPVKEGYKFKGWYLGEKLFDFKTTITSDVELVAKFEKITETNNNDNSTGNTDNNSGDNTGNNSGNNNSDDNSDDNPVADAVDKAELKKEIKKAEDKINEADYQTKYQQPLRQALEEKLQEAKEVDANASATLEEVEEAKINLLTSYEDLIANNVDDDNLDDGTSNGGSDQGGNVGEDNSQPNVDTKQAEDVEFTLANDHGKTSVTLEFKLQEKGVHKLDKNQIDELKASYLEFLTLNDNQIDADRLTIDMSSRNFKITISELQLNDILVIKQGLIVKATRNKETKVISNVARSTNELRLRYNGTYFVLDNGQAFEHIEAQNITLDKDSLNISSTQSGTIQVTYSPENSKGTIETRLPEGVSDVTAQVGENGLITVSTTRNQQEESQVQLTIILQGKNVEKNVTINIAQDVNNSSTSESNIITELTYSNGGTNKYQDGEVTYTNKERQEVTLQFTNGRKNSDVLDLAGHNDKKADAKGTLTLTLDSQEKVKKLIINLKSYKNDKKNLTGLNIYLKKQDDQLITKTITTEQITLEEFSNVTIDLTDEEAAVIKEVKFEVLKNEEQLTNNKPRIAINKITIFKLNA